MKPNKETYRILVIDDHPIVAEGIIALASQLEGVTCKGATCAKDVEQLTLKERFDLCIIDLELPDMNGFQLISHLHSQIPECGILIYTMHEEPWIIAKLSTLNINGAVSKNSQHQRIERRHQYTEKRNQILQQCFQRTGQGKTKHPTICTSRIVET